MQVADEIDEPEEPVTPPPPVMPLEKFIIRAEAGRGGKITPFGDWPVVKYSSATFTITPNTGYKIRDVLVDGESAGPVSAYTFTNVTAPHTIRAEFEPAASSYRDVQESDWFYGDVLFVTDMGLMNGVAEDTFAPQASLTRAMLVTMLYRLENEPAAAGAAFDDVDAGEWYAKAVAWASVNGIVSGYGDGRFAPDKPITREEMAVILYNFARYKGYDVAADGSLDVFADGAGTSDWALDAVKWAVKHGLLTGKGDGRLDAGPATRRGGGDSDALYQGFRGVRRRQREKKPPVRKVPEVFACHAVKRAGDAAVPVMVIST